MTHTVNLINQQKGFTLVEMAMVLLIVALLLGGMLVPLSAQMEQRNISDTQKALSEIKEAIIGYALANGQLPCPAVATVPTGQAGAGIAQTPPCTGTNSTGVLPWATLGVSETDAWGNRFTYRVTPEFADAIIANTYGYDNNPTYGCVSTHMCTPPNNPQNASFALCSCGALNVWSAASGGVIIAGNVPAVIISHGKNGAGAYTPQGTPLPVGSNADEQENSDGSSDTTYVTHTPTPTFDDLVVWISLNILFNRMVAAGKLP
jgi:prepilin-type N-terminal cleavage/methylation domain-containing protein